MNSGLKKKKIRSSFSLKVLFLSNSIDKRGRNPFIGSDEQETLLYFFYWNSPRLPINKTLSLPTENCFLV